MSSMNDDLIRAYKNTRKLIEENPDNKEQLITEYIDLVEKINYYYNSHNNNKNELAKMLKNPLEISIFNNFQRYNGDPNNNIINPIINPDFNTKSRNDYINALADVNIYGK
jgi:hypothetical protein